MRTRWMALPAILLAPLTGALAQSGLGEAPEIRAEYTIGIEDVLEVRVWGENDLTVTTKVRPDGKITIPLVNDLYVEGFTTQEVRNEITSQLSQYIRDPHVTVILNELNSYRVFVLGEVDSQGAMQFTSPTRLLQALASAGGLNEYSKKKIILLREQEGEEHRIEIDYKRVISGSDPNVFLEPGDMLIIK